MKTRIVTIVFAASLAFAAGCASGPAAPNETMAQTQGRIGAAEGSGAKQVPSAALHLQLAKEQSAHAGRMMKAGEHARAKWLLARAEADAELAIALADEDGTRKEAEAAREQVRVLEKSNVH